MSVTQLEMRLAPATLVGAADVTYLDENSQQVDVHISPGVFDASTINSVFSFNSGNVNTSNPAPPNTVKQQLREIDLTQLAQPSAASGATLTIKVTSAGTAKPIEVGFINATGIALGAVTVQGDLGGIDAGDGVTTPGLASLSVQSMGAYGTTTQAIGGTLESDILGPLGALTVAGNIDGAFINVSGGSVSGGSAGSIGLVSVGGSLVGGQADYSGEISASGDVGDVGGVTVHGSLDGGTGNGTGSILANGNLGPVTIGVAAGSGNVVGSAGEASGIIFAGGNLAGVTLVGSLEGGAGSNSGEIYAGGNLGPVQIGGDVVGAGGVYFSGCIFAAGNLGNVKVGGALRGGAGAFSGAIVANGNMDQVTIGKGVQGATGQYSGSILAGGTLAALAGETVTVGGAVAGGAGDYSGEIVDNGYLGPVIITGNLQGAGGKNSGEVGSLQNSVAGVTVGGSVIGGAGGNSGEIFANADTGTLGPVQIKGNLQGGGVSGFHSLANSGYIFGARIMSVSITGSVIAGQNTGTGRLTHSGAISATYDIGPMTVGNLVGNSTNPVVISARGQNPLTLLPGSTTDVAIAQITVTGSVYLTNIMAGYTPAGIGVNAAAQIGAVTVGGNWTASNLVAGAATGPDGQFGTADDVVLGKSDASSATSQIGAIVITGTVSGNVASPTTNYGFVAQEVASLTVGGKVIKLKPGLVQVNGSTVFVNEV